MSEGFNFEDDAFEIDLENEEEWEYTRLSVWERGFLSSVRQQFIQKHKVSDSQYQSLEKIWDKLNR